MSEATITRLRGRSAPEITESDLSIPERPCAAPALEDDLRPAQGARQPVTERGLARTWGNPDYWLGAEQTRIAVPRHALKTRDRPEILRFGLQAVRLIEAQLRAGTPLHKIEAFAAWMKLGHYGHLVDLWEPIA